MVCSWCACSAAASASFEAAAPPIIAIPIIAVIWAVFSSLYHRDPPIEGPLPDLPNRNGTDAHAHDSEDEDGVPAIKKILTDKLSIGGAGKEDEAGAKAS